MKERKAHLHLLLIAATALFLFAVMGCLSTDVEAPKLAIKVCDAKPDARACDVSLSIFVSQYGPGKNVTRAWDPQCGGVASSGSVADLIALHAKENGFHIQHPHLAIGDEFECSVNRTKLNDTDLETILEACPSDVVLIGKAFIGDTPKSEAGSCSAEITIDAYRRDNKERAFSVYSYINGGKEPKTCSQLVSRISREAAEEITLRFFGTEDVGG